MGFFFFLICEIALSVLAINYYFLLADRFNIIDKPNERSSHTKITIRGGAIVFPIIAIPLFIYWAMLPVAIGLFLVAAISLWDDIKPLKAIVRVFFHFMAFALMLLQLQMDNLIVYWWLFPILFVFCVGAINAYNFMDGINGITGLYSIVLLLSIALYYWFHNISNPFFDFENYLYLAIPLMVFLIYNFRKKAKTFAGDVGSISIAFVIVLLLLELILSQHNLALIFLMGLYGIDSILTLIQRLAEKENIFKAHRKHLYQILANERKLDHRKVALGYAALQLVFNLALLRIENESTQWIFIFSSYGLIAIMYFPIKKYLNNTAAIQ